MNDYTVFDLVRGVSNELLLERRILDRAEFQGSPGRFVPVSRRAGD